VLLESLSAALKKIRKRIQKSNWEEKLDKTKQKEKPRQKRNKSLPGRDRHLPLLVMLLGNRLPADNFCPGALGGRSLAGTGFSCRPLLLLILGDESLQEFIAELGLKRHSVVQHLWVGAGGGSVCNKETCEKMKEKDT
jgi:hypothetical protein